MDRRGFLAAMLAAGAAPAIVRAESIMRVKAIVLPGDEEFYAVLSRDDPFPVSDGWLQAKVGDTFRVIGNERGEFRATINNVPVYSEVTYTDGGYLFQFPADGRFKVRET